MRIEIIRGQPLSVLKIEDEEDVLLIDLHDQGERSEALREFLSAAEELSNAGTPLAALLNGALQVAILLNEEAAR